MRCGLSIIAVAALITAAATPARAVPGPDTTVVVANAADPESVALAEDYADARAIPPMQRCALELPDGPDIGLDAWQAHFLAPFEVCIADIAPRVEAVVLVRGLPLRVHAADGVVSSAAALAVWRSTRIADGAPVIDLDASRPGNCASPCRAGRWQNPFLRAGDFEPGWTLGTGGIQWRPLLVTRLDGRSHESARGLYESALAAEVDGPGRRFVLMAGADGARGVLDAEYDFVEAELRARGFDDVQRAEFARDRGFDAVAAFFVGTAGLGSTIEDSTFAPGAIVDNLTSLGAVPQNFAAEGEVQVSIARWVARGVAGVHGATAEPLNNSFPSRALLLDYVDGSTLAESYFRHMPFAFWQNLVLGDPMAAPYADRPEVRLVASPGAVEVVVDDPRDIVRLRVLADGIEVEAATPGCYPVPAGGSVLAVARVDGEPFDAKGWAVAEVAPGEGAACALEADAGVPDAGAPDAGAPDAGAIDGGAVDVGPSDARPDARTGGGPTDGGRPADAASAPLDARPAWDATPLDAAGADVGGVEAVADDGGGCATSSGAPAPFAILLLLLGLVPLLGAARRPQLLARFRSTVWRMPPLR